jgi:hypothetical protein
MERGLGGSGGFIGLKKGGLRFSGFEVFKYRSFLVLSAGVLGFLVWEFSSF